MYLFPRCHGIRIAILALIGILAAAGTQAAPPPATGVLWVDWAAEQMAFALEEAAPADRAPTPRAAATHSIESIEISHLREEIRLLRDLIEQGVIGRVISLENEVRTLRSALEHQQVAAYGNGPVVPQPGMALPPVVPEPTTLALATVDERPAAPFQFTVIDEWGRSPEVVAELGGNASTLIGIAGLIPSRSAKADVVALAQDLRTKYAAYDNINIGVFDTEAAAQEFATHQTVDSRHHVISVSRHKATGRDVVLYISNGKAVTLPFAPE